MNTTAVAITAIICATLVAFAIISEAGKTRRAKIAAEAERAAAQETPASRFFSLFTGSSQPVATVDDTAESEGEE